MRRGLHPLLPLWSLLPCSPGSATRGPWRPCAITAMSSTHSHPVFVTAREARSPASSYSLAMVARRATAHGARRPCPSKVLPSLPPQCWGTSGILGRVAASPTAGGGRGMLTSLKLECPNTHPWSHGLPGLPGQVCVPADHRLPGCRGATCLGLGHCGCVWRVRGSRTLHGWHLQPWHIPEMGVFVIRRPKTGLGSFPHTYSFTP